MTTIIDIPVRPLVEYVYRTGSIESGFRVAQSMQEGTRIHKQIQQGYAEHGEKEVHLKTEIPYHDLLFRIEGRCDGLWVDENGLLTVDEIKSTSISAEDIGDGREVHWAQAQMYGYMLAHDRELEQVRIQLTYVHKSSGKETRLERIRTRQQLVDFTMDTIAQYAPYAEMLAEHRRRRNASIEELAFPFSGYRSGQRQFAGAVYKTIGEQVNLFAEAPTGTGKTISTLFPAIKSIGSERAERLMYITAKTVTRANAEDALLRMQTNGLHLHGVTITAKDKVCFCTADGIKGRENCAYTDGYYDRINGAILDMLTHETMMTREIIEQYARKHTVCPFELSLDASYASDAVICDYNYVFDPRVSLKRVTDDQRKSTVLLVDEAHNLVDRGRSMFSAALNKSDFLDLKRDYQHSSESLSKIASAVNAYFIRLRKQMGEKNFIQSREAPEEIFKLLEEFTIRAEVTLLEQGNGGGDTDQLLETYFAVQAFLRIGRIYDMESHITYAEMDGSNVLLRMFCIDPSLQLHQTAKGYRSVIHFSATLSPIGYYRDMLGADEEDYNISIPSPFSREQLEVQIVPLSTRYRDREKTRDELARLLADLVNKRPGNYLAFFPSYQYMQDVVTVFETLDADTDILVQQSNMAEEERDRFLNAFQSDNPRTLTGFAVMGGIFSEGVDLAGDRLTGVIIVGVGLPQLGPEREMIREHFSKGGHSGYNYAYVYPGMNKVLQAGGRLIRTEQDRGLLMLVDDRFLQRPYVQLLPPEWRPE
ncbi:helicase C-terminal domain-containing protein [Paenibacillus bovis]|uniref:ATP-dependent helicase n=1 Tax=Paenibacillus bovis TaxID=1616788 RepID=A0A172ZBD6_9BACL|nr:helicase C-terminal domain-containing protein [Paenibacillus bovis]ANF94682.1 ATP-dependent helicase [Paenibacillus bovis]